MSKVTKAELYRNIARAIERDPLNLLPEFPEKFHSVDTSPGVRLYLREKEDGVVEYVHENCLANTILSWINRDVVGRFGEYQLDFKNAIEAARVWRSMSVPVTGIRNVRWPGETGLTFRRLPWALGTGPHPLFDELMSRISNSKAFMIFIGSLLVEESDMQQYIWCHGAGENGKGGISRFLHGVFGDAYSSQIPPLSGDKFWTSMILGKRLVVFPDCNNQGFVTSGLFKSLTGGDPVRCEQKQQPAFTRIMTAKYMFFSNERPALSSEKADQRRVIYCEIKPITVAPDPAYGAKLWNEGGAFLSSCLEAYYKNCPDHGQIPVDKSDDTLSDWVSTVEEDLETAWEHNFELAPADSYILPSAFQDRLEEIWPKNRKVQLEFRSWCERKHGIRKRTHNKLPGCPKVYFGVSLVFSGQQIRLSQVRQKELQEKWAKEGRLGSATGRQSGHLQIVTAQGKDDKDINFFT